MDEWTVREFLEAAHERGLVLYGTGYVANMLRQALEARGTWDCVRACLVTDVPPADETFHGVDVLQASVWAEQHQGDEFGCGAERPLICLAVHRSIVDQIRMHIAELGLGESVWVYPLIHELAFGAPLEQGSELSLADLLAAQPADWHWVAARACAFAGMLKDVEGATDEFAGFDDADIQALGESAYVKCMALHCGGQTARKRLGQARSLAAAEHGTFNGEAILVDERLRIIDGLHRVALAWIRGEQRIRVDIYPTSDIYDSFFTERNKLTSAALKRARLTGDERVLLAGIQRCIFSGKQDKNEVDTVGADTPEITVIVPVYNVVDYIDQCMESILAQTFGDFEVLLIDDGSSDGSSEKCDQWAAADTRFRALHQPNAGVSPTRNRGIEEARGTFLAFVDPDDWLDERYLERLHERAVATGADFVECDIWRYNNRNGSMIWRHCGQRMGVPYTLAEHMKYGPTASYKAISRRSLWEENGVRFPDCAFESPAIYALVLALANRVEYLPEPLYYYRRFRENSLVESGYEHRDGSVNNTLGVEAMEYLVKQFKAHGLYDRYAVELPGIVLYRLNDILAMQYHRKRPEDFAEMVANYREFVGNALPQVDNRTYITWGGYNLNKVCQHMDMLHDPSCRFNFSSLIAIAQPEDVRCEVGHSNRYRQMMVQREMDQSFWKVLEKQRPAFIVMDLLEERFDIVEWQGRYLTASDAWEAAELDGREPTRTIPRASAECEGIFRESVHAIAVRLADEHPGLRIVMVENYLAEEVGNLEGKKPFPAIETIRATNKLLSRLYDIACDELSNVVRVPAFRQEDYFTDEHYEYGAVPSHLNAIVNQRIGKLIQEEVGQS